jgi:hypothetical protein
MVAGRITDAAVLMGIEMLTGRAMIARRSADTPVQTRIEYLTRSAVLSRPTAHAAVLMRIEMLTRRTMISWTAADTPVLARVVLLTRWAMPCRFNIDTTALKQDEYLAGRAKRLRRRRLRHQCRCSHATDKADEKPKCCYFSTHNAPPLARFWRSTHRHSAAGRNRFTHGTMGQRRSTSKMPRRQKNLRTLRARQSRGRLNLAARPRPHRIDPHPSRLRGKCRGGRSRRTTRRTSRGYRFQRRCVRPTPAAGVHRLAKAGNSSV